MLSQSYFPFPVLNRKTIFSNKFSNFLRLLLPFTKSFVFNDGQITEVGKKYSRLIPNCNALFQKTRAFNKF